MRTNNLSIEVTVSCCNAFRGVLSREGEPLLVRTLRRMALLLGVTCLLFANSFAAFAYSSGVDAVTVEDEQLGFVRAVDMHHPALLNADIVEEGTYFYYDIAMFDCPEEIAQIFAQIEYRQGIDARFSCCSFPNPVHTAIFRRVLSSSDRRCIQHRWYNATRCTNCSSLVGRESLFAVDPGCGFVF